MNDSFTILLQLSNHLLPSLLHSPFTANYSPFTATC